MRDENVLDLVLLDIWMPDTDGVTLLKEWAATGKLTMPVIMMSGHATIDTAVEATRIGALDFLEKPIALQKLLKAVEQGLARSRLGTSPGKAAAAPFAAPAAAPAAVQPHTVRVLSLTDTASPAAAGDAYAMPAPATPYPGGGQPAQSSAMVSVGPRELPLDLPLREARDAFERAYFEHHLAREHGSMTRVAEKTGLERTHLYRKLKQLGIDLSRGAYRKSPGI